MSHDEPTRQEPAGLPSGPPALGLDRDMAFAEAERRLLGHELRPVTLDRFVVLKRVGQGAMGVVYAAHDPKLDRKVALKLVDTSGFGSEGVAAAQQRLEREAQAAAQLSHPNVAAIYDTGTVGDQVFLAMEFIEGTTLGKWLEQDHGWRAIVSMFVDAGEGLAAAHEKGIVHRDFKPDNVLVGTDGRPRVVDFGLARPVSAALASVDDLDETRRCDPEHSGSDGTPTTAIAGTPAYMAPEQYAGRDIGPHSDQFGFCVALYEALLGERPFEGPTAAALATAVLTDQRRALPRGHGIPPAVIDVVCRGLNNDPQSRYPSVEALLGALRSARDRRKRTTWMMAGAGMLALVVGSTYALARQHEPEPIDPCAAATKPLQEVWNDDRKQALAAAMSEASAFGGSSWKGIEGKLDAFATRWASEREDACHSAQHRGDQSVLAQELRYACLDRALRRMDVYVETIESSGMMAAIRGKALVDGLDRISRCGKREDLVLMMHGNGLAEQTDLSSTVNGLAKWNDGYEALDRAQAQFIFGDANGAIETAKGVADDAHADGLRALEAQAQLLVGRWTRDPQQLDRALDLAMQASTPSQAAEIAIAIAELSAGADGGDSAVAHEHLRYAERFLAREGEAYEGSLFVRIPAVRGTLAKRQGDNDTARIQLEKALALAEERLPPDHPDFVPLLGSLGQAYRELGDTDRARQMGERLQALQVASLGAEHPDIGQTIFGLGVASLEDRDLPRARAQFEEARDIWTHAFSADHPQTSLAIGALGEVVRLQGQLDEAEALQTKALTIREGAMGPDSPMLADPLDELGEIAWAQGDAATAIAHLERALKIRRAVEHPGLSVTLTRLGRMRATEADPSAGIALLQEALTLRSRAGVDPIKRAETERALAEALLDRDRDRAKNLARAAVDRYRSQGRRPEQRAEAERWFVEAFGEGSVATAPADGVPLEVAGLPSHAP